VQKMPNQGNEAGCEQSDGADLANSMQFFALSRQNCMPAKIAAQCKNEKIENLAAHRGCVLRECPAVGIFWFDFVSFAKLLKVLH
jgi:hypothetical protein